MKTIEDLTAEEKADLTPEEIEHFIAIEMMREGVEPAGPEPEVPPAKLDPLPGDEWWGVKVKGDGISDSPILFRTEAQARACIDLGPRFSTHRWDVSDDYMRTTQPEYSIELVRVPSQELVEAHSVARREAKAQRDAAEEQRDAWKRKRRMVQKVRDSVLDEISLAREEMRGREAIRERFREYLALAGGDHVTAVRFLGKLYTGRGPDLMVALDPIWPEGLEQRLTIEFCSEVTNTAPDAERETPARLDDDDRIAF